MLITKISSILAGLISPNHKNPGSGHLEYMLKPGSEGAIVKLFWMMSYGPATARAMDAQWCLSSVSGIGLIHSCCNMTITMPQVFHKVNMRTDSILWDFNRYIPDAVTICLGQNDGVQDSVKFCDAYVRFIKDIRSHYPDAQIVCLTSPMANAKLTAVLKNYLTGIVDYMNSSGDEKVHRFFFLRSYNDGCGRHPDIKQHQLIVAELEPFLKKILNW